MQHPTSTTPQGEERDARERQQTLESARASKTQAAQRRPAQIIRDQLASPAAKRGQCPITPSGTKAQLRAPGAGCIAGRRVCPTLDAIRGRLAT
jgi:hypothetical protein